MKVYRSKRIVLGITGSIAAYKAAELASRLEQMGAEVQVAMTLSATKFVGPLTFETLTHRPVLTDVLALSKNSEIEHVAAAKQTDLMIIAPATADTIARLAAGMAGDPITAIALDTSAPILIAPAMETGMWEHPATRENISRLRARGVVIVEPGEGHLASGAFGAGRLADAEEILAAGRKLLVRAGPWAKRRIVITAGGTEELLDPVRVLTNRSSGRMGYALADSALDRGAQVCLVAAGDSTSPLGASVVRAGTTLEMHSAALEASLNADALLMAAAPADFRPLHAVEHKIKKETADRLTIEFERNPDILEDIARRRTEKPTAGPHVVVGFSAETEDLIKNASRKLRDKTLDLIVANQVPETFGSSSIKAVLIDAAGQVSSLAEMPKGELAEIILDRIEALL